ncbi:unnamed protein product [marine sediment metagenome]|uniref:Uncharacterized protein n=1 Tax=marine sediment metagenome TaxID=412755 RepID=X1GWY6_9ZZZZ
MNSDLIYYSNVDKRFKLFNMKHLTNVLSRIKSDVSNKSRPVGLISVNINIKFYAYEAYELFGGLYANR